MLNDFEIITRHFPENNDIKIYPISDVHLGAAEHLAAEWDNFCKRILEEPNSYIIRFIPTCVGFIYEEIEALEIAAVHPHVRGVHPAPR